MPPLGLLAFLFPFDAHLDFVLDLDRYRPSIDRLGAAAQPQRRWHGWLGRQRQLHVQQRQQRGVNTKPADMDLSCVVFVSGRNP